MYAKLFSRITESSIIEESITTRWVFVALLAIAEPDGTVIGTDIAIARRINVPLDDFESSMKVLMAPDENSNNLEFDGKRVVPSVGERGYFLTGYARYRNLKTEDERRAYMKEYMAQRRAKEKPVNSVNIPLAELTHAEGELKADENTVKRGFKIPTPTEISNYGNAINFKIDGEHFWNYYNARGWKLSNGVAMKDWKSCVVTWKKRNKTSEGAASKPWEKDVVNP